jgi:hypothetical protein
MTECNQESFACTVLASIPARSQPVGKVDYGGSDERYIFGQRPGRSGAVRFLCERGAGTGVEGLGSPPTYANPIIRDLGLRGHPALTCRCVDPKIATRG